MNDLEGLVASISHVHKKLQQAAASAVIRINL
jgi:hypothetical protein